jgi:hypothetical protein
VPAATAPHRIHFGGAKDALASVRASEGREV